MYGSRSVIPSESLCRGKARGLVKRPGLWKSSAMQANLHCDATDPTRLLGGRIGLLGVFMRLVSRGLLLGCYGRGFFLFGL